MLTKMSLQGVSYLFIVDIELMITARLMSIVDDFLSVKDRVKPTFDPVVIMSYLKGKTIFNR